MGRPLNNPHIIIKNYKITFRMATSDNEKINLDWKRRTRPDPRNYRKLVYFKSKTEYLDFCMRMLINANHMQWDFIKYILNPDYPQEIIEIRK